MDLQAILEALGVKLGNLEVNITIAHMERDQALEKNAELNSEVEDLKSRLAKAEKSNESEDAKSKK